MIPKPPPREGALGFLYHPPFRVQGVSVAGEATCVHVPELDVCFDMGVCPRAALPSKHCAINHGHMDHIGGLAYYCSQRRFQGMGDASIVCDERIAPGIRKMFEGFWELEGQKTPYTLTPLKPEQEFPLKNNVVMRGFHTDHTAPSMGYTVIEKRSKLKEQYAGLPQEKLRELKERGEEITRTLDIPLVAFLGDTLPGPWLVREDVRTAKIVICECTFIEPDHKQRAVIGKHMHIDDIAEWLPVLEAEMLVLTHVSRRTNMNYARKRLREVAESEGHTNRVHFLMDFRQNRARYEQQLADAEAQAAAPASA